MILLNSGDNLYASVGWRSNNRPVAKVRQDRATILDLLVEATISLRKHASEYEREGPREGDVYIYGKSRHWALAQSKGNGMARDHLQGSGKK